MTWINMTTGTKFDYLNVTPESISLADFIWALSHQNRYAGHTRWPYTVLEHMCLTADLVCQRGGTLEDQQWALTHDLQEAVVTDIPAPLKMTGMAKDLLDFEDLVSAAIAVRLKLSGTKIPAIVKQADRDMVGYECRVALFPPHPDMMAAFPETPENINVIGLTPREARYSYIAALRLLFNDPEVTALIDEAEQTILGLDGIEGV